MDIKEENKIIETYNKLMSRGKSKRTGIKNKISSTISLTKSGSAKQRVKTNTQINKEFAKSLQANFSNNDIDALIKSFNDSENDSILDVINESVITYFSFKKHLLNSVYKVNTSANDLFYCVVLKENSREVRNEIFQFYRNYDTYEISNKIPVIIQFIPDHLTQHLEDAQLVSL